MSQTEGGKIELTATLSCTISKMTTVPNKINTDIISEYHQYMRDNGATERHQNNALKAVIGYARFLGENTTFYESSNIDVCFLWITR